VRALARKIRLSPMLLVFLPFAAGYHLSYLFRTVNATIAPDLVADLGLKPGFLGLMTSVYFLTFASVQLPLGVMLDRIGPRRTQAPMMIVAGIGAFLFARAEHPVGLLCGRGLIGVGVAAALIAGIKALAEWFPRERLPLVNGWFIMLGTAGSLMATEPSEMLVDAIGWRGLFVCLGIATVAAGALVFLFVPDAPRRPAEARPGAVNGPGLREIFRDPRFLAVAPLAAACVSTAWTVQGLWAARWLADVEQIALRDVSGYLFAMACTLSLGAGLLGIVADRLRRRGLSSAAMLRSAAVLFIATETAILLRLPAPDYLLWGIVAVFGAMTVLGYAALAEFFPSESAGRAIAALNVLQLGGAFILQAAIGFIVSCWPPDAAGNYPPIAYQLGLALPVVIQVASLLWFARSGLAAMPKPPPEPFFPADLDRYSPWIRSLMIRNAARPLRIYGIGPYTILLRPRRLR
jgi:MFS family permease